MTDLTKITTPFGLLDPETQGALMDHCGPWEVFTDQGWEKPSEPVGWFPARTYRVRPAPPRPREWWAVGKHLHDTEAEAVSFRQACADDHGTHHLRTPIIHVREVLE